MVGAGFVAGFLRRLGVEAPELDDAVQEVFLTAHRRGGFVAGAAQPTTWLAEIALRVASDMRRSRRARSMRSPPPSPRRGCSGRRCPRTPRLPRPPKPRRRRSRSTITKLSGIGARP